MPTLRITVIDHQHGQRRQHRTTTSPLRLGRDPSNDLILDDPYVARWQAVITFDAEYATMMVLSSSNPLRRGGRSLSPGVQVPLDDYEILTLGSLELRIELRGDEGAAAATVVSGPKSTLEGGRAAGCVDEVRADSPLAVARAAVSLLHTRHREAREARRAWEEARDQAFADLRVFGGDPGEGAAARRLLERELAELGSAVPGTHSTPGNFSGVARARGEEPSSELSRSELLGLVGELALELAPNLPPPRDAGSIRRLFARIAASLHALAATTVELQQIWADERRRLGIASPPGANGPLSLAAGELIEKMVDPKLEAPIIGDAVVDAAVGLQDHVRALLRASESATLELLERLAPTEELPSFDPLWLPWRGASAWRRFRQRYHHLCGSDRSRTRQTLEGLLRVAYARQVAAADLGVDVAIEDATPPRGVRGVHGGRR